MTQAIFSIEHPEFEEEIIESVAGAGETINKAFENTLGDFGIISKIFIVS